MFNLAILSLGDFENWNNKRSLSMGGASGAIKSILPYLKADNIFLMGITPEKKNLYRKMEIGKNLYVLPLAYVIPASWLPVRLQAFYYGRKLNRLLKEYDIQAVYSHAEELSFWIKPDFTFLYHMHGSTNAIVKAKNKLLRLKSIQLFWEYVRKKNINKADKIIAIDPLCYKIAADLDASGKTILMPNFVDTGVFYRDNSKSELLEPVKENILLFIGRIEEVKGLELFVDTVIEINKREPGKWKGVLVGRGTYEPLIKRYIQNKSSDGLFHFTGPVFEQDKLRRIYNRATVLMISSYFEGIPMVILESLACGTPVISTNVGGIKDLISDNKKCFVLDGRDPFEFANLLQTVCSFKGLLPDASEYSALNASGIINKILSDRDGN